MGMSNAERQRKHRAKDRQIKQTVKELRDRATTKGITVIENALVVITADGLLNVLEWNGEAWTPTHASRVVPLG